MPIRQIRFPEVANAPPWQYVEWTPGSDGVFINSGDPVQGQPFYTAPCAVVVNETGAPTVKLRQCGNNDVPVNLWQDDYLLLADDTDASTDPASAPITLTFPQPLRAVGAYVVLGGKEEIVGLPFDAVMWVEDDNGNQTPIHGAGTVGTTLPPRSPATAAFVGARGTSGSRIRKVYFDATLAGSFSTLGVSRLFWAA